MSQSPSVGQALGDAGVLSGIARAGRTRAEQLAAALDARIRSRGPRRAEDSRSRSRVIWLAFAWPSVALPCWT